MTLDNLERDAYTRQYFTDSGSLPIRTNFWNMWNDIGSYLQEINKKFGREIYKQ